VTQLNPAEQRFATYLDEYGYSWKHEPDYQAELKLAERLATTPDFLIERGGDRAVAEVRQFETTMLQDQLSSTGRAGVVGPEKLFGAQRSAMFEKAKQLRPLAGAGLPLLIVLANPLGMLVPLDDWHMQVAMWGNAAIAIAIDTTTGGPAEGHEPYLQLENYGAFASPVKDGDKVAGWANRHPHITAVVVVHERLHSDDWREEILARYRAPDRSMDAAIEDTLEALREVEAAQERGEEPQGSYRWVSVYEVNGEEAVPLPEGWFAGPRDDRYGYSKGGYGRLWPERTEPAE
jgi:hypothetical protein